MNPASACRWRNYSTLSICSWALVSCAAPAPVAPPQPVAPPAMVVQLAPAEHNDGATHAAFTAEHLAHWEGLTPHPAPGKADQFLVAHVGPRSVAVAFETVGDTMVASGDLDGDGQIGEGERGTLAPDGEEMSTLLRITFSLPGPDGTNASIPVELRVFQGHTDDAPIVGRSLQSGRAGRLALGAGMNVEVWPVGGLYDQPGTTLVLDADGDGEPDRSDRLSQITAENGVFSVGEQHYRFTVDAAGTQLRVEQTSDPLNGLVRGASAPDFKARATDGKTYSLADFHGRWLLLDFWATWCEPCLALHPEVEKLAKDADLSVVGISADDSNEELAEFLAKSPISWPNAAIGPVGDINLAFGVDAWPSHALIDPEGRLVVLGSFDAVKSAIARR